MSNSSSPIGFMLAAAFLLIAALVMLYDLYAIYYLPPEATVSHTLRTWTEQVPVIAVLIGIVLGHLYFPLPRNTNGQAKRGTHALSGEHPGTG